MGVKASRWLATLDLTKHVDGATVELIWDEYDKNHTGYLEGEEVERLLKHWCATHKISNFEQVRNDFWERFDVNKEGRIAKVNLLGGSNLERDSLEKEDQKHEEFKKSLGSSPKRANDLLEPRGSTDALPARNSFFSRKNSGEKAGEAHQDSSRFSLFGLRSSGDAGSNHERRNSPFGMRSSAEAASMRSETLLPTISTTSTSPATATATANTTPPTGPPLGQEKRGSLFDLNKSRMSSSPGSPVLEHKHSTTPSTATATTSTTTVAVLATTSVAIPPLNLRGPRGSLPSASAPRRAAEKARRSLPNPTLARVFSFLHDSSSSTTATTTSSTAAAATTSVASNTTSTTAISSSSANTTTIAHKTTPPSKERHLTKQPSNIFDLLTRKSQNANTATTSSAPTNTTLPTLLITAPTKPLPLAAQVKPSTLIAAAGQLEVRTLDVSTVSASFPSYLNPGDIIDKDLLRALLSISVPEFVLDLELGHLHAHNILTLGDAHRLPLQDLESIVRPALARGLHEFLHERRSSLSSPPFTPYHHSPNHSRSSQFREKLQGRRASVSWGSLSRSEKDNANPLDLLEPPARFRPSKRFVFNAALAGDDMSLGPPAETSEIKRNSI